MLVQQANEQTKMISTASPRRRKAETAELGSAGVKAVYPGGKNQNKQTNKKTENKKLRLILKHKKAQRRGRRIRTFHLHFVQKTERTSARDEGRWVENSRGSVLWIWDSGLSIAARPSLWVLAGDYILGSGQRDIGGG